MRLLRSLVPHTRCLHTAAPRLGPGSSPLNTPFTGPEKHRLSTVLGATLDRATAATAAAANNDESQNLTGSQTRFGLGEIYSPHSLSMEAHNVRRVASRLVRADPFDVLGIDPRKEYKNYNMLSEYVTSMGRILHRNRTGCRGVNQRRIAKAVRRAVGIGLLPSTHVHPEILKEQENRATQLRRKK